MNRNNLLVILSLGLNVCAVGVGSVWILAHSGGAGKPAADGGGQPTLGREMRSSEPMDGSTASWFQWGQLESEDYRKYIANLRAIGCPEETIKDIIVAEIEKLYAPKFEAGYLTSRKQNYWETPRRVPAGSLDWQSKLFQEKYAVIKELLGIDMLAENGKHDFGAKDWEIKFSFLPEAKRQQLRDLEHKYSDAEHQVYANSHGLMTPEDGKALETLRQQKKAEMDALLTPKEQLEYGLRTSPRAQRLQHDLDAFQPSEAEFRSIYQAQMALEEKQNAAAGQSGDAQASPAPAVSPEQEFQDQLKSALGDHRYSEYQLSKDPGYQGLLRIADRFGLAPNVASQVFDLKQSVEAQTRQMLSNAQLTDEQRQAALQSVRSQTETALTGMLGEQGFSVYRDQGGKWFQLIKN